MGVCNCSMFCCTLIYAPSSFTITMMGKRELVALLSLSSWCLMTVVWLFLAVPWVCLQFVIVVFPAHTHLLFILTDLPILSLILPFCRLLMFFNINFFEKIFQDNYLSVKQLGSRSGPTHYRACSGSKLFAKAICSRY